MQNRNRKKLLALLFCLLLVLTIGFAALSNSITISSTVDVRPDANSFRVLFSNDASEVVEGEVVPTINGSDVTASNAIINNIGSQTLSNLNINFSEPGQSVSYRFYMINTGDYDAYLNKIYSSNATYDSSAYKVCTALPGANQNTIDKICDDIEVIITDEFGNSYGQGDFYIDNYVVKKKTSILMTVTINYKDSDIHSDGDFIVRFGDILFEFNSSDM